MAWLHSYPLWCFCSRLSFCWDHFLDTTSKSSQGENGCNAGAWCQHTALHPQICFAMERTSLSLAGNSQQGEAPPQGHDRVTAILCVMLMDVSTLLPSWGPGHSSAPSGCTGEPRAQNAHAKGWSSCQTFVSGVPGSFASGKLFPVVRAALSSAPKPWHLGRVFPFVSFSFFPDLT